MVNKICPDLTPYTVDKLPWNKICVDFTGP